MVFPNLKEENCHLIYNVHIKLTKKERKKKINLPIKVESKRKNKSSGEQEPIGDQNP